MDNREIASLLKEIAVYKGLAGENTFKVRAFENTARMVDAFPEAFSRVVQEDRLREMKGIGKSMAEVIQDIVRRGHSTLLDELKASFPAGLREILALPGLGPKKVKTLWEKLGITTVPELEKACQEDRLLSLDGFGIKSRDKILKAIEFMKSYSGQFLFPDALEKAQEVVKILEGSSLFSRISIAGSLRRGSSLIKDADILLTAETVPAEKIVSPKRGEKGALQEFLVSLADRLPGKDSIVAAGETKVSIIRKGMHVDFRVVREACFPSALQHFTGSKEHNTLLRSMAKKVGLKMNEYGVFKGDEPLELSGEEDVYSSLGLPWIPPEIREGQDEIDAAERGRLPLLVTREDIKGMIHVHSNYSDGLYSIADLAGECIRRGFSYLCLSDHSRSAYYAGGLNIESLHEQKSEVERLNKSLASFRIFCGIESDILADGALDYPDEVLERLDFVIGSIHSNLSMNSERATERLLRAIGNPYLTMLGHPSGRLLLSREGYFFDEGEVYGALAENGVVLEHNCHPQRLDPDWDSMKRAGRKGILVSLNPDAHSIGDFDYLDYGVIMARKAWLSPEQILNCMSAEEIDGFFRERKPSLSVS